MDRLTKRDDGGVYFAGTAPEALCSGSFCEYGGPCTYRADRSCPILRMVDRLAEYEDTGFTPGQIRALWGAMIGGETA